MYRFVAFVSLSALTILGGIAGCKAAEEAKKDNSKVTVQKEIPAGKRLSVNIEGTADSADLKLLQSTLKNRIGGAPDDFAGVTDRIPEADATLDVKVATLTVQCQRGLTAHTIFAKCIYNVELVDKTDGLLFSALIEDFASEDVSSSVTDTSAKEGDVKTKAIKQSVNKLYDQIQRCLKREKWDQPKKLEVADVPKMRIGVVPLDAVGGNKEAQIQWADYIEQQFMAVDFLTVVNRSDVDKLMAERQRGASGEMDERTTAQLGKALGVKYVITGRFEETGSSIKLTLKALDPETERTVISKNVEGNAGQRQKVAYQGAYKLAQEMAEQSKP